ncbi:MAG: hypothetical protein AAB909_00070, partial [Patescibacteria group bacterium]
MTTESIVKYFLLLQLMIVVITLLAPNFLKLDERYLGGSTQTYVENPVLYSRGNFDGLHYTSISSIGYVYPQQAFFPLYPLVIRYLKPVFRDAYLTGTILSLGAYLLAQYFFVKLLRLDFDSQLAKTILLSLILFPTSFFFSFVYTEGIFFLFLVLSFFCARKGQWWLAGLFGALASATRV